MLATPELIEEATQRSRLAELLPRWLDEVPLYRDARALTGPGQASNGMPWHGLPFITKQDIRRGFPHNFLGPNADLEALVEDDTIELEHTSGTSEARTALLLPRGWWAEQEARALRLNPLAATVLDQDPGARRVTINSPVCSGDICYTGVPSRNERVVGNALFVNLSRYPFLWSESDLARMAAEATDWEPRFLDVDPVYGVLFALYCERRGIRLPSLEFIVCSYEFVSVLHRRILQRVFGVPVFNLYGSTETGHLLMENGAGEMQPSYETAVLEVLPADDQGVSELVVTTLTNPFMPLINYRIGDLVERQEKPFGTRYVVHGRIADAFVTPEGRRVTSLHIDRCFSDLPGIAHYQLIERPGSPWLLRLAPDREAPGASVVGELKERLENLVGGQAEVQGTDTIVPENSGKFRLGYPLPRAGIPAIRELR